MVHIFRKYQQTFLIILTVLVIVAFIWFWNGSQTTHGGMGGPTKVATIYGRSITDMDTQRVQRKLQIAMGLGLGDLVQGLAGNAQTQQEAFQNFIVNSYVFEHEADALGVFATDAEVQNEMARVPGFQTDGRLDPRKLDDFVQNKLPALGFTDSVIDDLVRDQVRVRKVEALIGGTLYVSPIALHSRYVEENEKMDLSIIRLNASDIEKGIPVSDAEAQKAYDEHKDLYHSDELRKVSIANFDLTAAQKELKGKDRTDALQTLGNQAWTFAQAVVDKSADFAGLAQKAGARVSVSGTFSQNQPDPSLPDVPAFITSAFGLTPSYPSSDVVEGPNGYFVLHLEQVIPSRQLSFEEAKPNVVAQIKKDRAAQLMQTAAGAVRSRVLAVLKEGKSISDAAKAAGVQAVAITPFSLLEASKLDIPDTEQIIQNAVALSAGQLSDFVQTQAGGLFVYMGAREPIDPVSASLGEQLIKDKYARQKEINTFAEWLRLRKEAARLQIVQR